MRNLLLLLFITLLGLSLTLDETEAARLGGGRNLGRSAPNYSRSLPAAPPSYVNPRAPAPAAPGSSGLSRWLGPVMGFAAGGLLASLLLGHGFEGLQLMDLLILAGIGLGIYFLIRALAGRNQSSVSNEQLAPAGAFNVERFQSPDFNSSLAASGIHAQPLNSEGLAWFNEKTFLQNARNYFVRLQAAWDAGRMEEIEEYVTPDLYRELVQQRATLGPNFTEVINLNVDFLGLAQEGNTVFAGVRYSGLIREQQNAPAQPFTETWHIQRSLSEPNANWYVAGIQQN